MQPERGDVVRSVDPFKFGESRQRPWLIVNNDAHPFDDEQYVVVAVSTRDIPGMLRARWGDGG